MVRAGINVGIGTDGAASNNRLDLFCEMRTAALLAKAHSDNAESVPAHTALRMSTLNAAKALGLERSIGSIEPGKFADLCAVDLDRLEMAPCYHPTSHLVYAGGREHVSDVWVAGRHLVKEGRLVHIDEHAVRRKAADWRARILGT
jgi:5-methylthioadenosine/S-adenosylhomocysteine deaminase